MDTVVITHFERTMAAAPAAVPALRHALVDWAVAVGVPEDRLQAVRLAVSEAVTNAVMHAFIDRDPGHVSVTAQPGHDELEVRVIDDGRGMGPRPDSPGLGMGVSLIGRLCATVYLSPGPDGAGTEVRMVFATPGLRAAARDGDSERHVRDVLDALEHMRAGDGFGNTDISSLAGLLVPRLADFCSVTLLEADGRARRISACVAHPDGSLDEAAAQWAMEFPVDAPASPSKQAAQLGRTQVTAIDRAWCHAVAPDAQRAEELLALGLRWWVAVPLRAAGQAVGSVAIAGRSETPDGVITTVERIAEQAAGLVATARLVDELRRTQARLERVLGVLTEAVVVTDGEGRGLYANQAAATLLGARSVPELLEGPAGSLARHLHVSDADGVPLPNDVLATAEPQLLRTVDRRTGVTRWLRSAATLLEDGPLLVTIVQDVTAATEDEQRQRLLASASDILAASLGRPDVAEQVARLAVPAIADGCVVDLVQPGGLRYGRVHHVDAGHGAALDDLRRRYPPGQRPSAPRTATPDAVLETGAPGVLNGLTDAHLQLEAHDEDHLEALRAAGMRAVATVPLTLHGRLLGTLTLANDVSGRVFSDGDVALAQDLAHRAAIAIDSAARQTENARTHEQLEDSLRRLRVVADAGFGGLIRGVEDRIVEANQAYLDMLGYATVDEVPPWPQMTPPEWAATDARAVAQLRQRGVCDLFEKEYWRRDGTRVRVLIGCTVVDTESFTWLGVVADVSDRRATDPQAEAGLDRVDLGHRARPQDAADVLGGLSVAVVIQRPDGEIVFANQAAADSMGLESPQAVVASSPNALGAGWDLYDEQGVRLEPWCYPNRRIIAGERTPEPLTVRAVHRASGRETWSTLRSRAVLGPDGALSTIVTTTEDITETRRAILTQRLLAEAGEVLSSALDLDVTLPRFVELPLPELADWCSIVMPDGHGAIRQVAVATSDPDQLAVLADYDRRWAERIGDPGGAAEILRGGPPSLRELGDAFLDERIPDPDQRAALRRLGLRSVIQVPVAPAGGPVVGVLSLVQSSSDRVFGPADLALAEELGRRAGTAIHHARLHAERAHIAETLQASLLPDALPEFDGFALAAGYDPAGALNWVGGDFYDAFPVADGFVAIVGDVAGHGAGAAALTAQARHTLRAIAEATGDPVAALAHLNRTLVPREEPAICTVCVVHVRLGADGAATAAITCAGHPLPALVRGGAVAEVGEPGLLLGAFEAHLATTTVDLAPGDVLVIHTDGIVDVRAGREPFGDARLHAALAGAAGAADAVARVQAAIAAFASGPPADDTTLLAIERR